MEIRELTICNIESIKKLMLAIFSKEPWNDTWTEEQLHLYIRELIDNRNSLSFGIYEDEALIGMALGHIKHWYEGTEYWIEEFGIHPEIQNNGIGTNFIRQIEKILAGKGVSYVVLLTEKHMPAYEFYKRNGFQENEGTVFLAKKICKKK